MTRINTNVSSLIAQQTLGRSHDQLQQSLTRLSTGLRINSGKDDPAGLIASEVLKSNITATQKAIDNSQRANQLIATADSALGQVSSLLNDVRGLVSDSANSGALSAEQIQANQLQVDSSLQAIDRIAQTTSFQGKRLLDGSLDFITSSAGTADTVSSGTFGTLADVASSKVTQGVTFTAKTAGAAANGYSIIFTDAATVGTETASIDTVGKTLNISIKSGATSASSIVSVVNANAPAAAVFSVSGTGIAGTVSAAGVATTGGVDGNKIILSAVTGGTAFNDVKVVIATGAATGAETAAYVTSSNTLTITENAASTTNQVLAAINTNGVFAATTNGNGLGTYSTGTTSGVTTGGSLGSANLSDLKINQANFGTAASIAVGVNVDTQAKKGSITYAGGNLGSDTVLEVGGQKGFSVVKFGSGSTVAQIATALNNISDSTGVAATVSGGSLLLTSSEYGSSAFVSARAVSGSFATTDTVSSAAATRSSGTDVAVRVNGVKATGNGLTASLNSPTLDLSFNVNSAVTSGTALSFSITGGGATFQLGPDVVSNGQARLGIQGVSIATLGGVAGKLYQLQSGGNKDLSTDVKGAAAIVDQVVTSVGNLRGRLGAFQKTTLDTNINTLGDTLQNLTEAQSTIRDTDFAAESARLTRAQILVQAGTSVLQLANNSPQQVLALLPRG